MCWEQANSNQHPQSRLPLYAHKWRSSCRASGIGSGTFRSSVFSLLGAKIPRSEKSWYPRIDLVKPYFKTPAGSLERAKVSEKTKQRKKRVWARASETEPDKDRPCVCFSDFLYFFLWTHFYGCRWANILEILPHPNLIITEFVCWILFCFVPSWKIRLFSLFWMLAGEQNEKKLKISYYWFVQHCRYKNWV